MDPLSAFSLACGVIQVVDFGAKVVTAYKEISEKGSLSQYEDLEKSSRDLIHVRNDLTLRSNSQSMTADLSPADKRLLEIARECSKVAKELVERTKALCLTNPRRKRDVLKKSMKALWQGNDIQALEKKLSTFRVALDTQLLVDLRKRSDLHDLQHQSDFQSLNTDVQRLITGLAEGPKQFDQLKDLTRNEAERTRDHVNIAFRQHREDLEKEERRKRFLDGLWFPEIHSREERIVDAHAQTFEWIFDNSGEAVRPWSNFVEWLESGEGTYWINGKAGSGKSTLMSFLCQDDRTRTSLQVWAGNRDLLIPRFYFSVAGTFMEKSTEGLLRSLIWQVLKELPVTHVDQILDRISSESQFVSSTRSNAATAWTERRLHGILHHCLMQISRIYSVCFFIDGLDEFDGDQYDLVQSIEKIARDTDVKVCLSSRPERAYDIAFGLSSQLKLQDLTREDIQQFVNDKLQGHQRISPLAPLPGPWLKGTTSKIVRRANGVFLWVSLAVKDQIRGLNNGDSPQQLKQRLEHLPSEVEGIYERMLDQIQYTYRSEAAKVFEICLRTEASSILDFAMASCDYLDEMLESSQRCPDSQILDIANFTQQRIAITCAGLLEIHINYDEPSDDEVSSLKEGASSVRSASEETLGSRPNGLAGETLSRLESSTSVDFIHRTAIDFMRNWASARSFLEVNLPRDFDVKALFIKTQLAIVRILGKDYGAVNLSFIMLSICEIETERGKACSDLCNLIDATYSKIDTEYQNLHVQSQTLPSNWPRRWAPLSTFNDRRFFDNELELDVGKDGYPIDAEAYDFESVHTNNNDLETLIYPYSPNFVGIAAYFGLRHYVEHYLKLLDESQAFKQRNHLLLCVAHGLGLGPRFASKQSHTQLDLMRILINSGADPNLRTPSVRMGNILLVRPTTWLVFLLTVRKFILERGLADDQLRESLIVFNKDLAKTIECFISLGTEIGTDCHMWLGGDNLQRRGNEQATIVSYQFQLVLSAVSFIDYFLVKAPVICDLRELIRDRGTSSHTTCNKMQVYEASSLSSNRERWKQEIFLSSEESIQFFKTLKDQLWDEDIATFSWDGLSEFGHNLLQNRLEHGIESKAESLSQLPHIHDSGEDVRIPRDIVDDDTNSDDLNSVSGEE